MNTETTGLLFALLRSAICGEPLNDSDKALCSEEILTQLAALAKKHDILHLVALGLQNNGIPCGEKSEQFENSIFQTVYRIETLEYELNRICFALEKAQIPFIPLKGSVIRKYYPESWMRTSCDIDILVHEGDSEKACAALVDEFGYVYHEKGSHDISLFSPSNIHVELHYDLVEDGLANSASQVLKDVWDMSAVRDGYAFWYEMSDEYYYFYHIAHMAKHFENGGCGIRPFIDIYILDGIKDADTDNLNKLLLQGNLIKFANAVRMLSRIWFFGEPYDYISCQMEDYILSGGVYGNNKNRITVQQQKRGGKFKYMLSKIFIPYETIKFHYPILQKYRLLTPLMEVRRWFKLVFCGHAKRTLNELKFNQTLPTEKANETKSFLENIGL